MNIRISALPLFICVLVTAHAQSTASSAKESVMTNHATGPFDVKVTPQEDNTGDTDIGRLTIDKQYHGELDGAGKGQMLTSGSVAKGSAGYVAMERVTGKLKGRTGSFTLQHSGSLNNGAQKLLVTIVPGSGAGDLEGIAGKMTITITGGKH